MILDQAIKILQTHVLWCDPIKEVDTFDALKLGIEAMKHMKSERTIYGYKRHFPLLGETEKP